MPRRKDIWRCGLVRAPFASLATSGRIDAPVVWLPEEPAFTFLADPFGWRSGETLHVFAEHYDYRTRHGTIERLSFDASLTLVDRRPSLAEPWHLSYPALFEGEGAIWMLPEAHRSGGLMLYRDHGALDDWRPECRIALDCVPVDASILHCQGRWWLFYSPATSRTSRQAHLHVAWADSLCGAWTPHPGNPVRIDSRSSRPGGLPVLANGGIMLPVQDCSNTYGGAIRILWIERLDETHFEAVAGPPLAPPPSAAPYDKGMHSLTACGDITLIDVKRIDRSLSGLALDVRRRLHGYAA